MIKASLNESQEDLKKFPIISGTTYGSSFVGMVHIVNVTSTSASESLTAAAQSMQATMDAGAWFAKAEGRIGVNSKFASDVKNLLSQQNVQCHITLLTMGVIPSMVANEVGKTVEKFTNFSPEDHMKALAAIQAANSDEQSTVKSMAESSRASGQAADTKNKEIEATLSAISVIDGDMNKVLDTNSMMLALDDYLQKAAEGDCGVPINFYLKDIDQKMLAQMWVAKYFPGQYMTIKYDDTEGAGPAEPEKAKL
ncbi:hypothetical protein AK830_g6976 [Neonectria ditissima]|uniref:Uncharacterized protein n=1 Tax=Neonectria ditissima TaxID=78410 RepID=A0A0P7BF25_9HYPO|nr:hypothetical protein AK830_g6976 [Neonectria ditissima]